VLAIIVVAALAPAIAFALSPDPPTALQAVAGPADPAIAILSWDPPAGDSVTTSYRVYASTISNGSYRYSGETSVTTYTFADGFGGVAYYFRVTAVNADGDESTPAQAGPVAAEWMASPHASATVGGRTCDKCHTSHEALDEVEGNALLFRTEVPTDAPGQSATCFVCHDGRSATAANVASGTMDSFALSSGHSIDESPSADSTAMCSSCHGVHRSTQDAPMLPGGGLAASGPEACYECHSSDQWYEGEYPGPDSPDRDASGYPIAGPWPGEATFSGPSNAHRFIPETTQTAGGGGSVNREEGDCLYCHAAHRGSNAYDALRYAYRPTTSSTLASDQADGTYALACFVCHGGVVRSGFTTAPTDIKGFVTSGDPSAGHRVVTTGGVLPVGAPLPCYECHNQHGSTRDNKSMISDVLGGELDTSTDEGVRRFCLTCHTTADKASGWDSDSATYTVIPASEEVVGIPRTGGVLGLPDMMGHSEADTTSCYVCHGGSYAEGGNNVHNPGAGAAPDHISPTSSGCFGAGCHDSSKDLSLVHAQFVGPGSEFPEYSSSCALCHANPAVDVSAASDLSCAPVCHSGTEHSGYAAGHALTAASDECTDCHDSDIAVVHGAVVPGSECATCHSSVWNWSKNGDCAGCHNGADVGSHAYSPPDSNHYSETTHTATPFSAVYQGAGTDGSVPTGGEECSACHSAALEPAHVSASTSGGSVTCVECHTDATLESSTIIGWGWFVRKCTDCHDSGAATTHDSYDATHVVEPGTCAGTGAICHDFTDLTALHATSQSGGLPKYQGCGNADANDPSACHSVLDTRPAPIDPAASCGEGSGGCHTEKNPVNHGYDALRHTAAPGSGDVPMGAGADDTDHGPGWSANVDCTLCHFVDLATQHGSACPTCHTDPNIVNSLGTWTGSCQQGFCHPSIHGGMAPDHNGAYYSSSVSCDSCHTGSPEWPGDVDCTRCHTPADTIPDLIAPTTTSDAVSSYAGDAVIGLTATDNAGGRGVDRTYYILDGSAAVEGTTVNVAAPSSGSESHTLQYYSVDLAGNIESPTPVPAFGFALLAGPDTTAPSGTMTVNNAAAYATSTSATVDSAVSDSGSGMFQMSVDPGTGAFGSWVAYSADYQFTLPGGDGSKTVRVQYSDIASNTATLTDTIILDTTPPSTTSDVEASYSGVATITLSATDGASGSGVAATHYRIDSGPEQTGTTVLVDPPSSGIASHTIHFWSVDYAGLPESESSASFTVGALASDTTPPTTSSSFNPAVGAIYNSPQSVTLNATDTGGSGVKSTYLRTDTGPYSEGTSFTIAGDGLHTFSYYSVDNADNAETANVSNEFRIDSTAPVTAVDATESATYIGAQAFTLTPTDSNGSGVAETWWQLDSTTGPWTSGTFVPVTSPPSGSQAHTLYWYSSDVAGNIESTQSVSFNVAAPVSGTATLAFMWEPEGTGMAQLRLYDSAMTMIDSVTLNGTGTDLDWFVDVPAGQVYYMECYEADDGTSNRFGGVWTDDTSINVDGVLSDGETVYYWY